MQSDQLNEQISPFIEETLGIMIQFTVTINENFRDFRFMFLCMQISAEVINGKLVLLNNAFLDRNPHPVDDMVAVGFAEDLDAVGGGSRKQSADGGLAFRMQV